MKFGERAFIVADPAVWHSLPTDIRTTSSPAFKKKLKTFLFLKFYDIIQTIRLLDLKNLISYLLVGRSAHLLL